MLLTLCNKCQIGFPQGVPECPMCKLKAELQAMSDWSKSCIESAGIASAEISKLIAGRDGIEVREVPESSEDKDEWR